MRNYPKGGDKLSTPLTVQTAGGPHKENCATLEGIFRIIQSIPSKKAEPFKQWMASVADYRRLGFTEGDF